MKDRRQMKRFTGVIVLQVLVVFWVGWFMVCEVAAAEVCKYSDGRPGAVSYTHLTLPTN